MKHVLIPTKLDPVAKELLEAKGFSVVQDSDTDLEELIRRHPETEALIVRSDKITADVIDALPDLRLVVRAGAGYNTIDIKHARRRGVDVMNTPGANSNAVAEEVFAMALAYYRHIVPADISTRQGKWEKKSFMGRELHGKTLGIVGLGNIGQLVARRARGFEMTLIGYDPVISSSKAEDIGVRLVSLRDLFAEADIVTLHVPENDDTRGMVNRELLECMKPGAVLINCARAGILDEDALRAVKAEKQLGFCNDVYPADKAGEKSVADIADLMLPHLGASTVEANYNAARRAAEQIIAYVEKGVTTYVVNKGVPDGLDENYQQLAYQIVVLARHYLGPEKPVRHIRCSFYGELGAYAKWFLSPICAGLSKDFDPLHDPEEAGRFLADMGITVDIRETDERKRYGNAITIDLLEGEDPINRISIRGTIAENNLMISRIGAFDHLYFVPEGHALFVVYEDRPGVLARIAKACADADINIEDIRAPRDAEGTMAIAVLATNRPVPASVLDQVREAVDPERVFAVSLG